MMRSEIIIVLVLAAVAALAFGVEQLGPDAARIIALSVCGFLLLMTFIGLVVRVRMKRSRAAATPPEPPGPEDRS